MNQDVTVYKGSGRLYAVGDGYRKGVFDRRLPFYMITAINGDVLSLVRVADDAPLRLWWENRPETMAEYRRPE